MYVVNFAFYFLFSYAYFDQLVDAHGQYVGPGYEPPPIVPVIPGEYDRRNTQPMARPGSLSRNQIAEDVGRSPSPTPSHRIGKPVSPIPTILVERPVSHSTLLYFYFILYSHSSINHHLSLLV